jgi:hypothetical protein
VHPAIVVEAGLEAAIRALARRSPLPVRVRMRADGRLPGPREITAYYVATEAFTNAAKHPRAPAVDILIEEAASMLTVQVSDDGVGGADATRGSGQTGLRDRVAAMGGSMTLDSPAGAGTVSTALLPVTAGGHDRDTWCTPAAGASRPGKGHQPISRRGPAVYPAGVYRPVTARRQQPLHAGDDDSGGRLRNSRSHGITPIGSPASASPCRP